MLDFSAYSIVSYESKNKWVPALELIMKTFIKFLNSFLSSMVNNLIIRSIFSIKYIDTWYFDLSECHNIAQTILFFTLIDFNMLKIGLFVSVRYLV